MLGVPSDYETFLTFAAPKPGIYRYPFQYIAVGRERQTKPVAY